MDAAKHDRSVRLLCATCGGDQFAYEKEDGEVRTMKCASCDREYSKDELIELNRENISENAREIGQEVMKDAAKEMRGMLKNGFRGSKFVKFK